MAFQDLFKTGIKLCKLGDIEVTRREGKKTTTVGDIGVVMKGITAECQVEMTEENTMMVKVARQLTLNEEEMEGVKVEHKVELTVEYNIAVKVVQMEGNVVEEMRVAKARALGEITMVIEKRTVAETAENTMNQQVDVVVKEGI